MITKSKSLGQLIKDLDSVFSEYIRVRDAKPFSGLVHCFICRTPIPWKSSHAMHFVDRDQMALRYDEVNVNGGCQECNVLDDDHRSKYRLMISIVYGVAQIDRMEYAKHSLQKFMRPELIEKIGYYKGKVQELRNQKHI